MMMSGNWSKEEKSKLDELGAYYLNMFNICKQIFDTGPIKREELPVKPNININQFFKPAEQANESEVRRSLKQLSNFLAAKICDESECGWEEINVATTSDVDQLAYTVNKGK